MRVAIAPSLLAADFTRLGDEIARLSAANVEYLHVDVMDGHFVPNITFGPPVVQALKRVTAIPLDVHLMIQDPDKYVPAFVSAGASIVTVHAEATPHLHRTVRLIRELGAKAGVAINPATPVHLLDDIVTEVDLVLVMSVNPGFTGQKFLPASLRKIETARALIAGRGGHAVIEVDGGIDASNIASVVRAGATVIVAGAELRFSDALSHPEPETYCTAVVSPLNVPPPLLVMPTVCVALPVNVSAVGAATIVGGVVTVKVTGTSRGVLVAPGAAMRTLAV